MGEYQFQPCDPARIPEYAELICASHGFADVAGYRAYLPWLYGKNPEGLPVGYDALFRGKVVAHYITIPKHLAIEGVSCPALLSLNTVTHPDHRGKGLFPQLAEKTYETACHERKIDWVVGVSNQMSTKGMVTKLGFTHMGHLEARLGIGPLPSWRDEQPQLACGRSHEFMKWRLGRPQAGYVLGPEQTIWRHTGRYGIFANLGSQWQPDFEPLPAMKAVNPVRLWIGLGRAFDRLSLYRNLPLALRPAPLALILRSLKGTPFAFDQRSLHFELIDFDVY